MKDLDSTATMRALSRQRRMRQRASRASAARQQRPDHRTIRHFNEVTYCQETQARWEPSA